MAPRRKKVGNQGTGKGKEQFRLGDLVMAKVKGYVAWPAKISKPEDWKQSPDPKRCFVQFFGTSEIAFVVPADIQVFTIESKSELHACAQRKHSKFFAHAVEEICKAFEELHGRRSDKPGEDVKGDAGNVGDNILNETMESEEQNEMPNQKETAINECSHVELLGLDHCSQDHDGKFYADAKDNDSDGHHITDTSTFVERDENYQSLVHQTREENCMARCLGSKRSDCNVEVSAMDGPRNHLHGGESNKDSPNVKQGPLLLASSFNSRQSDLHKKAESCRSTVGLTTESRMNTEKALNLQVKCAGKKQPKDDPHEKHIELSKNQEQLATVDNGRENSPICPRGPTIGKEKVTNSLLEPEKHSFSKDILLPGHSLSKVRLGLTKGQGIESSVYLGDQTEKRAEISNKRHKVHIPEELREKTMRRQRYANDTDEEASMSGKSGSSYVVKRKGDKPLKKDISTSSRKSTKLLSSTAEPLGNEVHLTSDEDLLPSTKRHRQEVEESIKTTKSVEDAMSPVFLKNDTPLSDYKKSPIHIHTRHRTLQIDDDEIHEEVRRTPIHGRTAGALMEEVPNVSVTSGSSQIRSVGPINRRDTTTDDEFLAKFDGKSVGKHRNDTLHQCLGQIKRTSPEKIQGKHASFGLRKQGLQSFFPGENRTTPESPKISVGPVNAVTMAVHKTSKPEVKTSATASVRIKAVSSKHLCGTSQNCSSSYNQVRGQKLKMSSSEKLVSTQKKLQMNEFTERRPDINLSVEDSRDRDMVLAEGFGSMSYQTGNSMATLNNAESFTSMKHLIAVARAKRRQAHSQCLSYGTDIAGASSTTNAILRSPSPIFATEPTPTLNVVQKGQPPGGSLNGGTEAAAALDALGRMIETLSRTKESIGRATRLAIDCVKHGIASEVVDLLIQKLENEPSFHRRVDLFFLVDSITQYSHSQKGIAGASYIPIVEAALPRLVSAAAPPEAGTRENHRQCLKVLRLWLERKIFPESLLRPFMDGIKAPSDDMSSGRFLGRFSRVERSVDDPIREIEGMLVDEYGSNAAFELPGFLSMHIFEDEEDLPRSSCDDVNDKLTMYDNAPDEQDGCMVTPTNRQHHVLDMDCKHEIEAPSASSKDDIATVSFNPELKVMVSNSDMVRESTLVSPPECPTSSDDFAHIPLDSPPPPPPTPPPLPLSPPPPPPHPQLSAPLPLLPPPPPPFLPPQSHPPLGLPPSVSQAHLPMAYHSSAHQDYYGTPTGHNASLMTEAVVQRPPIFAMAGVCNTQLLPGVGSSRSYEFEQKDMYVAPQASHHNLQFQPGGASFAQRSYHTLPTGQTPTFPHPVGQMPLHCPAPTAQSPRNNFSFARPIVQHHVQQQQHPYSLPIHPNGKRQYIPEEQWKKHSSNANFYQYNSWVTEWRSEASLRTHLVQDGHENFLC